MQNDKKEEQNKKHLIALNDRRFIDGKNVIQDKIYFTIKGEVIGTSGNFVTLAGLPKAGKTRYIGAAIASAILKDPVFGLRFHLHENKTKIALFDTEQSPYDFNRLISLIKQLSFTKDLNPHIDAFLVREDSAQSILQLINIYLEHNPGCGILVIDGLLDLLDNMNDEGQSKRIIRIFKRWTKIYDCLIVTVLHMGKQGTNTLGHIGASSDRYAQSSLEVTKEKNGGGFTLSPKFCRSSMGFDPINIYYDDHLKCFVQNSL